MIEAGWKYAQHLRHRPEAVNVNIRLKVGCGSACDDGRDGKSRLKSSGQRREREDANARTPAPNSALNAEHSR
jgi:hypothetical protein